MFMKSLQGSLKWDPHENIGAPEGRPDNFLKTCYTLEQWGIEQLSHAQTAAFEHRWYASISRVVSCEARSKLRVCKFIHNI